MANRGVKKYAGLHHSERAGKVLDNFFRKCGGTGHIGEAERQSVCDLLLDAFDSQRHADLELIRAKCRGFLDSGDEKGRVICLDLIKELESV